MEKRPFCNAFTGCGKRSYRSYGLDNGDPEMMFQFIKQLFQEAKLKELQQKLIPNQV